MTNISHIAPFTIEEFGLLEQSPPYLQIGMVQGVLVDAFAIDTGTFFTFLTGAGEIEQITYNSFLQTFVDYLAFVGFGTWTYSYDFDTCTITLDGGVNTAAFTFDATSKKILGMESSGVEKSLYTSTVQPWFIWKSTEGDWQNVSYPYETVTVVREKECDDGRAYQLSNEDDMAWLSNKPLNVTYLDWEHHWEPRTNIYNDYSSSINSYTYQQHLSHIRSGKPFAVFQGSTGNSTLYSDRKGTYKIRADKSAFKPVVSNKNLDSFWNISLETRQLSLGTNFGTYNPVTAYELFEPRSIDNCILWLDGNSGIELDSISGKVKTWYDQSGYSNHLTQSNSVKQPTYDPSDVTFNNQATLGFDGTNSIMQSISIMPFFTASSATAFAVWEQITPLVNTFQFIWTLNLAGDNNIGIGTQDNKFISLYRSGTTPNASVFSSSNPLSLDTAYMANMVFQTYNSGAYFSGNKNLNNTTMSGSVTFPTVQAGTIANNLSYTIGDPGLGAGIYAFKGNISELIIFNRELLDTEINQVNSYLSEKYGI